MNVKKYSLYGIIMVILSILYVILSFYLLYPVIRSFENFFTILISNLMISLPVFLAGLFYYRFGKKGKKDNKLFLSSFILIFLASVLEFVLILYINISWALSTQKDPLGIPLTVMILGTPILVIFVLGVLLGLIDFIIRKFRK